jgi:hypothetical protein
MRGLGSALAINSRRGGIHGFDIREDVSQQADQSVHFFF